MCRNMYQLEMCSSWYWRFLHELQSNRAPALRILKWCIIKHNKIGVNVGHS